MMLLLDIGNSRVKWRYMATGSSAERGATAHDGHSLPTELDASGAAWTRPDRVLAANVAGADMEQAVRRWARQRWNLDAEMVTVTRHRCGVTCGYENPTELGVDRWTALIGARDRHPGPVCVVDCGTAVTVDAVAEEGDHIGGAILPGTGLMRQSLATQTRALPNVTGAAEIEDLGRTTRQCILFGTSFAVASSVNGLRARVEARLGMDTRFFLTGGDADWLRRHLEGEYAVVPELVLDGLGVVARQG